MRWRGAWIACGLILLFLLLPSQSALQQWKIGVVNAARITALAERLSQQKARYEEQRKAYLDLINLRQTFSLLTGLEWAELRMLLAKTPRTREEEKRLEELRRIQIDREVHLQRLQQTSPALLSPTDKANLENLTKLWKSARSDIEELRSLLEEELKRIEQAVGKEREERATRAIEKVARDQDLDIVLDQAVCYYSRSSLIDITDEVIKALEGEASDTSSPPGSQAVRTEGAKP